jgi:dTDP-glucose 4,6-dehydratase
MKTDIGAHKGRRLLITGGAGFIGSAVVRQAFAETDWQILVLDKLTYAGSRENLGPARDVPRCAFVEGDVVNENAVVDLMRSFAPDIIMHLAAESHVDRSISDPGEFLRTNVIGTFTMLNAALGFWDGLDTERQNRFRFHHVSTDEVYGSLGATGSFSESSPYRPNSPYSASKASADHLVRAWHKTYKLPVVTTNCTNNFGPYQFPEKLVPRMIYNALHGKPLPIYGKGDQVRDWLYVEDHAAGLLQAAVAGRIGEAYCISSGHEMQNLELVAQICTVLDELRPAENGRPYRELMTTVTDRLGHDRRYAMDSTKFREEFSWVPSKEFSQSLRDTVQWYLDNQDWCARMKARVNVEFDGLRDPRDIIQTIGARCFRT